MELSNIITAADVHNIGNTQTSWLDPESWSNRLGTVGKFAVTSILSGANSFYNTGATVASWAGYNVAQNDTNEWISAIDSDYGAYYRQNKESVDLAGFVLSSLVPGLGGIKALHAGQMALKTARATGLIGGNLSRASGMLVPDVAKYTTLASQQINQSTAAVKLLNVNTAKAIGSGFWQNTLEAAAFETAVQATMFKSPVLEQQDISDIATNIAVGGALCFVITGAFTTAGIFGKIKQAVRLEDAAQKPFVSRPQFVEATSPAEKIISLDWDSQMSAVPVKILNAKGDEVVNNYAVNKSLYEDKIRKNNNDKRTAIHQMAGGDTDLANLLANASHGASAQQTFENFSGAKSIVRAFEKSKEEVAFAAAIKKGEIPETTPAARWVQNIGENPGATFTEAPLLPSLGDLHKGQKAVLSKVHEYGFTPKKQWNALELKGPKAHLEAEARYIWAAQATTKLADNQVINRYDIPLLEKAYQEGKLDIKIQDPSDPLNVITPASTKELWELVKESKEFVANRLLEDFSLKKGAHIPIEQGTAGAAKIVNVRQARLEGTISNDEYADFLAHQDIAAKYKEDLRSKGLTEGGAENIDPMYLPKYAKIVYDVSKDLSNTTENVADAIVHFKEQQRLYVESAKFVAAKVLGKRAESLLDISDTALWQASRTGSGAGLFSFQNGNYGSLDSSMAFIGSITQAAKQDLRKKVTDALEAPLVRLAGKQEAAIEFEAINQQVSRSTKQWTYDAERGALVSVEKNAQIDPDIIPITNIETRDAIQAHIEQAGQRTDSMREIRASQGHTDFKNANVFRPIRPNPKDYPHFAFVVDTQVTGTGHMTMLHAASEKELAALIDKAKSLPGYKVHTKTDVEEFKKARGEYEFQRTLHENYINSDLSSKGIYSNFFPKTDPQKIVDDILQQHYRESDTLVSETIRLRYEPQFNYLEDLGRAYGKADTSRFASRSEILEKTSDNPFFNYIKTALDISKASEHSLIHGANKLLDEAVSKAVGAIRQTFQGVKSPEELDKINTLLDQYGMKPAYHDAALDLLSNHSAPKGELTKFVRKANAILSRFTLGLDPLNAVNNAIGSNILRMTELRHITKAIESGDTEIAGELANIAKVKLPGVGEDMLAPTKLVAKAIGNFWSDNGTLIDKYKNLGYIRDRVEQLKLLVDDFTLKGTESVADLDKRINTGFQRAKLLAEDLGDKGEKLTGNKFAEEFNRFISANVMDQITEIAKKKGLMSEAESQAYINTFVNRVEGNILASQRPLIFQGPIGQAIGLFQSYQFNLLQQLFRYSAEGSKKDLATLLGLQSTLYGLQSLPGFQFINTHIVGQLSGNKEHRDAYDAVYGTAGKTAGDWMLYGIPSNILHANIYSRGDINPRQITVLPTSMQETPLVAGWGKFLLNMYETSKKIGGGGNVWESLKQGLEHNGISRPLAGFAQVLQAADGGQVYSTSNKGSILFSNDLMSWSSLVRLAGGRPLDEAVTNDALYRVKTYEAARRGQLQGLSETVKSTLIQDSSASEAQILTFAQRYAELGGKQAGFNKWMMDMYRSANVSQSQQLEQSLKNPFSYKMQLLMGGNDE
jgi:hypothetical protein